MLIICLWCVHDILDYMWNIFWRNICKSYWWYMWCPCLVDFIGYSWHAIGLQYCYTDIWCDMLGFALYGLYGVRNWDYTVPVFGTILFGVEVVALYGLYGARSWDYTVISPCTHVLIPSKSFMGLLMWIVV